MAYGMDDRVREQAAHTNGSGAVTLPNIAVAGFQTFLAGWGASGTGEYMLSMGSQWETGYGTLNAGGTQLTRTEVYDGSSGSGVAVNFSNGTLDCIGAIPAELAHFLNMREIAVASASTCDVLGARGSKIEVTGTTGITSFGTGKHRRRRIRFSNAAPGAVTHNATSLIIPGGANRTPVQNEIWEIESDASSNVRVLNIIPPTYLPFAGKLIKKTTYTGGATWTRAAGTRVVVAEVIGGGGSGGGATSTSSNIGAAGGGGGGGYSRKIITTASSTETVTVGSGGAAPSAGNNNGNAGGTSSFGAHCSATGGAGGGGAAGGATSGAVTGGAGGAGASGDENLVGDGGNGGFASTSPSPYGITGKGGMAARGGGGGASVTTAVGGNAGQNYGGGGSGALSYNAGGNTAGGAGAGGLVVVWEYE